MVNWSNLPREAVEVVSKRLENGADYVRFRSVCSSWRSWAPKKPQFPWLLVKFAGDDDKVAVGLYNFPNPRLFRSPHFPDGITKGKFVCGCSGGWISLLDSTPRISLHNPFTGAQIQLPPFTDLPISYGGHRVAKVGGAFVFKNSRETVRQDFNQVGTYLAKKVILSSDPAVAPNDCVVMGMMYNGQRLIFLLPGADSWTVSPKPLPGILFEDIIYYKGRFYAVSKRRLFACDLRNNAEVTEIPSANPYRESLSESCSLQKISKCYLVESSGELLLVRRTECNNPTSYTCEVYLVDLSDGQLKLLKLRNLGNRSLFLGLQSMSVSAGNFPGCQTNCIYSIEHSSSKFNTVGSNGAPSVGIRFENNMAVFNMEDGSFRYISKLSDDTPDYWWSAHWLMPSLCD